MCRFDRRHLAQSNYGLRPLTYSIVAFGHLYGKLAWNSSLPICSRNRSVSHLCGRSGTNVPIPASVTFCRVGLFGISRFLWHWIKSPLITSGLHQERYESLSGKTHWAIGNGICKQSSALLSQITPPPRKYGDGIAKFGTRFISLASYHVIRRPQRNGRLLDGRRSKRDHLPRRL